MCTNTVVAGEAHDCSVDDGWTPGVDKSGPLWIIFGRPQGRAEMTTVTPILMEVIHWFSP